MIAALLVFVAAADTGSIELVCTGGGTANKADTTEVSGSDNFGNGASATITGRRSEAFADQIDLIIDGEESRIRLPRIMLPVIHGGKAGWFKLKNVEMTATTIKASAGVNFLNSPRVYVDRRTGNISINGKAGNFSGQCERVQADAVTKF